MNELREQMTGKWSWVLERLGIDEQFLRNKHGPCPNCGGKDRYRFHNRNGNGDFYCNGCGPGDAADLLMRVHGWSFNEMAREVRRFMGIAEKDKEPEKKDPSILLKRIAGEAKKLNGNDPATMYLKQRGLTTIPSELFYHDHLAYYEDGKLINKFPAMLAVVRNKTGEPLTYHITYLDDDHKADVSSPKKVMPPIKTIAGGAIRLFGMAEHIGLAEGIETAIAAHEACGYPVWAAVSAGGIESFEVPEGITSVTIFGDNDESYTGQKAAYVLAHRLTVMNRIKADVIINPTRGGDFLDDCKAAMTEGTCNK